MSPSTTPTYAIGSKILVALRLEFSMPCFQASKRKPFYFASQSRST